MVPSTINENLKRAAPLALASTQCNVLTLERPNAWSPGIPPRPFRTRPVETEFSQAYQPTQEHWLPKKTGVVLTTRHTHRN